MAVDEAGDTGPPGAHDRWYEKPPGTPLERFPLLGDAMAAVAKAWTESFNGLSASPGEIAFKGLEATAVADLAVREDGVPIFASLRAVGWDGLGGLVLGRALVSLVVEALFGGGGDEDLGGAARPVSAVEMRMVDVIGGQAAVALTAGFRDFAPARIEFDRTQPKPDARFLGKPGTPVLAATFEIKAVGRAAPLDILLPMSAIEAGAAAWGGAPSTVPVIDDTRWTLQLRAELARAAMALRASIPVGSLSLGAIADWRVGQVVELPPESSANVMLTCENETLFRCDLGQSTGRYTVRIEERLPGERPPSRKEH